MAAWGLAGCSSDVIDAEFARRMTKEQVALLKRQQAPKCDYRAASADAAGKQLREDAPQPGETSPDAALRTKLDYERQCYKHAEMIVRARLTSLQAAVQSTANSVGRSEGGSLLP